MDLFQFYLIVEQKKNIFLLLDYYLCKMSLFADLCVYVRANLNLDRHSYVFFRIYCLSFKINTHTVLQFATGTYDPPFLKFIWNLI